MGRFLPNADQSDLCVYLGAPNAFRNSWFLGAATEQCEVGRIDFADGLFDELLSGRRCGCVSFGDDRLLLLGKEKTHVTTNELLNFNVIQGIQTGRNTYAEQKSTAARSGQCNRTFSSRGRVSIVCWIALLQTREQQPSVCLEGCIAERFFA